MASIVDPAPCWHVLAPGAICEICLIDGRIVKSCKPSTTVPIITCACCSWFCPTPGSYDNVPATITVVDSVLGNITLTLRGGTNLCTDSSGPPGNYCQWTGSKTIDYPGFNGCAAVTGLQICYFVGCVDIPHVGNVPAFWIKWNIVYPGHGAEVNASFCPALGACAASSSFNSMPASQHVHQITCAGGSSPWSATFSDTFSPLVDPDNYWNSIYYDLYEGNGTDPVTVNWTLTAGTAIAPCMNQIIVQVNGCLGSFFGGGLVGATVTLSQGGMTLATGITNAGGKATFLGMPNGSITVVVTYPGGRFQTYTSTQTLNCGGEFVVNMQPGADYVCCGDFCNIPYKKVLHGSDSVLGATTLIYEDFVEGSCSWFGTSTYSYGGSAPLCVPCSVELSWEFTPDFMTISWPIEFSGLNSCPNPIPGAAADSGECLGGVCDSICIVGPTDDFFSCPPMFSWTGDLTVLAPVPFGLKNICSPALSLYNRNGAAVGTVLATRTLSE